VKKIILIFIFLTNLTFYGQNDTISISKKDSANYYSEAVLKLKNQKKFEAAFNQTKKLTNYAIRNSNDLALGDSFLCDALINYDLKNYDIAIEKIIRALSILNSIEPSSKLALGYYNLGLCYMQKENFNKAEPYFDKAELVYENLGLASATPIVMLQKAIIYKEKNNSVESEKILQEIINSPNSKDIFETKSEAYYYLSEIKTQQNQVDESLKYLNSAYKLSVDNENLEQQVKISKKLSTLYDQKEMTSESFKFLKIYSKIKDSLAVISNPEEALVTNDFGSEKIIHSIEKKDKEKKEQEKARKFYQLINILSIALITILSLLSIALYKNNLIRNKSNSALKLTNIELETTKNRIEKVSLARSEFLSTVSHELRTPLNAINGISHILLNDNPNKSQIEYLKSLKFSGNYLLTYINDILEINRIESNNIEIEDISFDLKELLANIKNSLLEQAHLNNNNFNLNIDKNIPDLVKGDPTKLSQIFINLINNALKFTKNGTVTIDSKVTQTTTENCNIEFNIKDTGIGIPVEKMDSIFESFSQGSVEINRKFGGTGLGLTIVKRLVDIMGGKINVKSNVGLGSDFSFNLDFAIGNISEIDNINFIECEKIFIDKKILLVEDNKINQMVTKKILETKLMLCEICETGEDAIEIMKTNSYDLVLMDVHLPGINGTVATAEIRKFDTETPIIALTAISLNENRDMLMSFGMDDVVTKPFNPDNLYKILEENFLKKVKISS
jgi:signal transduction histidine kinase/ActR/RegA family two-component response regulator